MKKTNNPLPDLVLDGYAPEYGEDIRIRFNSEAQIVETVYPRWTRDNAPKGLEMAGRIQHLIGIFTAVSGMTGNADSPANIRQMAEELVVNAERHYRYCKPCEETQEVVLDPTGPECTVCGSAFGD